MNLPKIEQANKYIGLYVVDFGDTSSVGFTANEVAELLESEQFADVKIYKIHNAYPDGTMELKGVPSDLFQLEMGMFFYAASEESARKEYDNLIHLAESIFPPCRAKVELAKLPDDLFMTAIIYPAEYDDQVSAWLIDIDYKTSGAATGGISAVTSYYEEKAETLESVQLNTDKTIEERTGIELIDSARQAVQR